MTSGKPIETYKPTPWKWVVFSVFSLALPGLFWLAPIGLLLAFGNVARLDFYADRIEQHYVLGKSVHRWDEMENIRAEGVRQFFIEVVGYVRYDKKTEKTGVAKAVGNVFGGTKTVYPFGLSTKALERRMIQYRAIAETGVTSPEAVRTVLARLDAQNAPTQKTDPQKSPKPARQTPSMATAKSKPKVTETPVGPATAKLAAAKSTPLVQEGGWFRRDRSNLGGT